MFILILESQCNSRVTRFTLKISFLVTKLKLGNE